jgi:hypothetical protein
MEPGSLASIPDRRSGRLRILQGTNENGAHCDNALTGLETSFFENICRNYAAQEWEQVARPRHPSPGTVESLVPE